MVPDSGKIDYINDPCGTDVFRGEQGGTGYGGDGALPRGRTDVATLYKQYAAQLHGYARSKLIDEPCDADDVVHDVFSAYSKVKKQNIKNVKAYLFRMVRNFSYGYNGQWQKRYRLQEQLMNEETTDGGNASPEHLYSVKERHEILLYAIKRLPEKKRQMLVLHRIEGLTYAEIARRTNVSQTTIKRLVAQAVEACRYAVDQACSQNTRSK